MRNEKLPESSHTFIELVSQSFHGSDKLQKYSPLEHHPLNMDKYSRLIAPESYSFMTVCQSRRRTELCEAATWTDLTTGLKTLIISNCSAKNYCPALYTPSVLCNQHCFGQSPPRRPHSIAGTRIYEYHHCRVWMQYITYTTDSFLWYAMTRKKQTC